MATPKEEWRVVVESPWYSVSNLGRVKNRRVNRVLRPSKAKGKYAVVSLAGVIRPVHHLVMEAFSEESPRGKRIAHIDGDNFNNAYSNLTYISPKPAEYRQGVGQRGRAKQGVRIIDTGEEFESMMAVADRLGTSVGYISHVLRNRKAPGVGRCKGVTIELMENAGM